MVAEARENKLDCLRIVKEPATRVEGKWQWLQKGATGMTFPLQSGWYSELAYSAEQRENIQTTIEAAMNTMHTMTVPDRHVATATKEQSSFVSVEWDERKNGFSLWQWQYHFQDTCERKIVVQTEDYEWSMYDAEPPRCKPGTCNPRDDSLGRCCSCRRAEDELPQAVDCSQPGCDPTDVAKSGRLEFKVGTSLDAGDTTEVPCSTASQDYVGIAKITCTKENVLLADAENCILKERSSSPPPLPEEPQECDICQRRLQQLEDTSFTNLSNWLDRSGRNGRVLADPACCKCCWDSRTTTTIGAVVADGSIVGSSCSVLAILILGFAHSHHTLS